MLDGVPRADEHEDPFARRHRLRVDRPTGGWSHTDPFGVGVRSEPPRRSCAARRGRSSGRTPCPRLKTCPRHRRGEGRPGGARLDDGPRSQTDRRVEIPLECTAGPTRSAGHVERHAPVHADHLGPGFAHERRAAPRSRPRNGCGASRDRPGLRGRWMLAGITYSSVFGRGEHSDPAVEQLHRGGSGLDLGPQHHRGSASRSSSATHVSGSPRMSLRVFVKCREGPPSTR